LALAAKWKVSNLLQVVASIQLPLSQNEDKKTRFLEVHSFPHWVRGDFKRLINLMKLNKSNIYISNSAIVVFCKRF